jgi:hypothetical protein
VAGTPDAWRTLEDLYAAGRIRAIGVSNFHPHHIEDMQAYARVMPMLDQIESHPLLNNQALIDWLQSRGIAAGAWSPLGGPRVPLLQHPVLTALAGKYGRSPAQIVLRWDIQRGIAVIPKSSHRTGSSPTARSSTLRFPRTIWRAFSAWIRISAWGRIRITSHSDARFGRKTAARRPHGPGAAVFGAGSVFPAVSGFDKLQLPTLYSFQRKPPYCTTRCIRCLCRNKRKSP